jgi:predicted RND superfamily exporter protein
MRIEEESNKPGKPWQRAFAVIGIVAALLSILLIIPALFGIGAYRRWQRGERGMPVFLIGWGVFISPAMLYVAVLVVASMILGRPVEM